MGYKAPNPKGLWIDISAGIEVIDDNNKGAYRYVKHETPKDPYSFDITVSNLGLENAHFSGTLTMANGVFAWEGSFVTKVPVKVAVPQLVLPKPPNLEGSIEELRDTLPYAQTNEGDPEKGGLRKGDDAAQRYGDELMSKVRESYLSFCFTLKLYVCEEVVSNELGPYRFQSTLSTLKPRKHCCHNYPNFLLPKEKFWTIIPTSFAALQSMTSQNV